MRKIQTLLYTIGILTIIAAMPFTAFAQGSLKDGRLTTSECGDLGILCGTTSTFLHVSIAVWNIILDVLVLTAVIATAILIYSGVRYIMSRGNEEETRKAKAGIIYTVVGLVVIAIAGFLVNAIIGVAT